MVDQSARELPTLAERIDYLFTTVHPVGRGPYSNPEVAAAIQAESQVSCSASFLYLLRTGKRDNPSLQRMAALARFFQVDPAFFFDHHATAAGDQEMDVVLALREEGVKDLAITAAALSQGSRTCVRQLAGRLRELEVSQHRSAQAPCGRGGAEPPRRAGAR